MIAARRPCGCIGAAALKPYTPTYFRAIRAALTEGLSFEDATEAEIRAGPYSCDRCRPPGVSADGEAIVTDSAAP